MDDAEAPVRMERRHLRAWGVQRQPTEASASRAGASEPASLLRALLAGLPSGVVLISAEGAIVEINEAALQILGAPLQAVEQQGVEGLCERLSQPDGAAPADAEHPLRQVLRTGQPRRAVTLVMAQPHGDRRWVQADIIPVPAGAAPRHVAVSLIDVTARVRVEHALQRQALHDALTGLPNRLLLHDRMQRALREAEETGVGVALLLMDLDHFKEVNDTLGHHYGDLLLQHVGLRVQRTLRTADTVARLGGDEFAMLLHGGDEAGATRVARAISEALDRPMTLGDQTVRAGASIGIALYPEHGTDGPTLLRHADVAMYTAKRSGGGHALYTPAQDRHSHGRLSLITALRQAIAQDEMVLYYQPKVNVQTREVTCVEALIRWQHPERGLLAPDQFIPLAEQTGLIVPLSRWVLDTAIRQCRDWARAGQPLAVAVNLSMANLQDAALPDVIAALLRQHDVAPGLLLVEVTESAIMADAERTVQALTRLAELGVQIAIDDFGTGYSSLSYLKELPVHEIKIDKSFVFNLASDAANAAIVSSTIGLSHSLGLRVVTEGVEDQASWDLLSGWGCDEAQGYLFSRPVPAEDLARWLRDSPWAAA